MSGLKKYILLIITALLVIVSCNLYRYCAVDWYNMPVEELDKLYFEKHTIQEFNLYESKLANLYLYKNIKYDLKLLIKVEWIKNLIARVSDVPYYSFSSYITKINNIEVFKDFLRIYPFNFFF
ncbi:MAG TPA: hypothetical protein PLL66_04670 [Bacteroidales bacterium]|nr:hypothetical protein [Bacteroidales bacterium]